MTRTLTIEGGRIDDIPTFYAEINRVFMTGEDWVLGQSLDALDDLLYGGYGAIAGPEPVLLVWRDFDRMEAVLGFDATIAFLENKLTQPDIFDPVLTRRRLDALQAGEGQTYLAIVREIIDSHPNIRLEPR